MSAETASFWKSGNPRALFASFLYFDTSFMVWVLLGVLGNFIASDLGLSDTQKGLMTALPLLSGAILRPIMGVAADRFGGRRAGLTGMTLTLVGLAIAWMFANHFSTLVLAGLLLGIAGASFAVAMPMVSRWYPPRHQGLALGIAGAGNGGTVIAAMFAPRLAEAWGWHAVFGIAMLPILAALAVFALWGREAPDPHPRRTFRELALVIRERDAAWFCLFYAVTFGGFVGLASYLSVFYHDEFGVDRVSAGDLTAACVLAASVARPAGGFIADRVGGARVLIAVFAVVAAIMSLMSHVPPLATTVGLLFAGMVAMGIGNGAVFQLIGRRFGDRIGSITGMVGACGGLGGFFLPLIVGTMRDATDSYGGGFLLLAMPAGACAIALAVLHGAWRDAPEDQLVEGRLWVGRHSETAGGLPFVPVAEEGAP